MIAALVLALAQQVPRDTVRDTVAAITVSVTRATLTLDRIPGAVSAVRASELQARPALGLDDVLTGVAGIYAANRWNFSLDQRVSVRGFGARSSFGIRGIKVLLDGIPQTLPDGSGQLTNVELLSADRIEVLRGPSAALYGNASGGVINIRTDAVPPPRLAIEARSLAGSFDRRTLPGGAPSHAWAKHQAVARFRAGAGHVTLMGSALDFDGERQHTRTELGTFGARYVAALGDRTLLAVNADLGGQSRADNPGALTAAEMAANRDSAAAINLTRQAGKEVSQLQGGVSLRRAFLGGGEASLALFGVTRRLRNPQTFGYIDLDRVAWGARLSVHQPLRLGVPAIVTVGLDFQRQRDDRLNRGNVGGSPDTVRQLDQLERVTEIGPFAQSAFDLWPHTTVTAGARYDWVRFGVDDRLVTGGNPDDSGRRLMHAPSLFAGVTHRHPGVTLYANAGTSFETPTTTELANRPDTAGGFNATLDPQRALSYEVGARGTLGARLRYSAALFQARVRDALIAYQIASSPGRVFYQNAGRSRHQGVELEAGVALVPGTRVDAAWTWSDFRYTAYTTRGHVLDGRRLPGIPEHWAHLTWSARPAFANGAWLELQQHYASGYLVDDTLGTRTSPWHTVDIRAGWTGMVGGLRVAPFLALNNAFDRHYVGSVVINAANGRYYEPAPGRNGYVGISMGFVR